MKLYLDATPQMGEKRGSIRKTVRAIGRISTWPLRKGMKRRKSMEKIARLDDNEKLSPTLRESRNGQPASPPVGKPKRLTLQALKSQSTCPQKIRKPQSEPSSSLLKLPLELRQQIWQESLGGHTLHFRAPKERLICFPCRSPDPTSCGNFGGPGGCESKPLQRRKNKLKLLSPVLTCRQIYSEAIEYLYSNNRFVTTDSDFISSLPSLIPQHHLSKIRTLHFTWILSDPPVPHFAYSIYSGLQHKILVWETIWGNLAAMQGLDDLYVKLCTTDVFGMTHWDELNEVQIAALVEPIGRVGKKGRFELDVTFACEVGESPWRELPCVVRRVQRVLD